MKMLVGFLVVVIICLVTALVYVVSQNRPVMIMSSIAEAGAVDTVSHAPSQPAPQSQDQSAAIRAVLGISRSSESPNQSAEPAAARAESKSFNGEGSWQGIGIKLGMSIIDVKSKWRPEYSNDLGMDYYQCPQQGLCFVTAAGKTRVIAIAFRTGWKVFGVTVGSPIARVAGIIGQPGTPFDNRVGDDYQESFIVHGGHLQFTADSRAGNTTSCVWSVDEWKG